MSAELKYSPMIEQYLEIKNNYKEYLLFYRVGDFYEMFFDDAYTASRELELALTGKDAGREERVPMCGVPFHAADQYIEKLVSKGYKVAIGEQIEDPKSAVGLVKRGIIKIITPGTIDSGLEDKENNFIASIINIKREYVLCYSDMTTGEGYVAIYKSIDVLMNEILSLHIKEIVLTEDFNNKRIIDFIINNQISLSYISNYEIPDNLLYIAKGILPIYHKAIGILVQYFIETKKCEPTFFKEFMSYNPKEYLHLDAFTKKNLELVETLRLGQKNGSLLWLIDKCQTAMGSRLLHKWIDKPLTDLFEINKRLDFVDSFNKNIIVKNDIKQEFKNVYDLERIIGRMSSGSANAKDLVWLRRSLHAMPTLVDSLAKLDLAEAKELSESIDIHEDLCHLLDISLVDNPPLSVKEGGLINDGFNEKLDEIRNISKNGKEWILNYEAKQKELTNIKTLKVGYNRVTGYFIEVSKGAIKDIPEDLNYQRRATLVNAERFITPELKQYEEMVLNAKDQIEAIEYELFVGLRNEACKYIVSLQKLADVISVIDCFISLSDIALKYNYVRPTFNENRVVNIVDGRHPVLETIIGPDYIVNDCVINKYNMMLITGPNMSGKSTYMRMLALIIILAQIGSFVPAKSADLMIFDSIYTRIGASDDLVSGQSTFMVEMTEANYAISNATKNSLVLFDEIGRGTATFDGMALAQSILEYLHEKVGCITLFSTHYHELTALESKLKRLKNVHVEAKETDSGVVFLHKVIDGPTDKSYGINVASLAGLPKSLIERSKQVLQKLEEDNNTNNSISLDLFNFDEYEAKPEVVEESKAEKIKKALDEVDVNRISPIEALNILNMLKEI
ncbi:MAG: DNA mismatch repair protein MutS [Acholeplasmatales bacterium]|nr:DNA mismatch repair protein MutS [Acholeplasmatales bacterium]